MGRNAVQSGRDAEKAPLRNCVLGGPRLGRALYSGLPNAWTSLKVRHKSSRGEEERGEEGAEGAQKKKRKG